MSDILPILKNFFSDQTKPLKKDEFKEKLNKAKTDDNTVNNQVAVLELAEKNIDRFDKNNDGQITLDEINDFANNNGNKDGKVTSEDFPATPPIPPPAPVTSPNDILPIITTKIFAGRTEAKKELFKTLLEELKDDSATPAPQKEVIIELIKNINNFDLNSDGKISLSEVQQFAKEKGNKAGKITKEDFPTTPPPATTSSADILPMVTTKVFAGRTEAPTALFKQLLEEQKTSDSTTNIQAQVIDELIKNINSLDTNQDGKISLEEVQKFAREKGNKDGQITKDDFIAQPVPRTSPKQELDDYVNRYIKIHPPIDGSDVPRRVPTTPSTGVGIEKPINLGTINFNPQEGLIAQIFIKLDLDDQRDKVYILIYSKNEDFSENTLIKEYRIELGEQAFQPEEGTVRTIAGKKVFFRLARLDKDNGKPKGAEITFDATQPDKLKSKIVELLFEKEANGNHKIKENLLRYFNFREGKGIYNLLKADYEKVK